MSHRAGFATVAGNFMEPTYTVQGGDGKPYGPVSAEQLRAWAGEGRVTPETQVWRSDLPGWVAAATLPELGLAAAPVAALPPVQAAPAARDAELVKRMQSGASWFYWIAAFSIVNSILRATGAAGSFALGLGVTALIDEFAAALGGSAKVIAIALNLAAAAVLALFGFFAGKGQAWAFIVGMVLLGVDTALTILGQAWLSLALHAFALFCIFAGFRASHALKAQRG